jgi:uncharacterized protein YcgL (UPF0745 family)
MGTLHKSLYRYAHVDRNPPNIYRSEKRFEQHLYIRLKDTFYAQNTFS